MTKYLSKISAVLLAVFMSASLFACNGNGEQQTTLETQSEAQTEQTTESQTKEQLKLELEPSLKYCLIGDSVSVEIICNAGINAEALQIEVPHELCDYTVQENAITLAAKAAGTATVSVRYGDAYAECTVEFLDILPVEVTPYHEDIELIGRYEYSDLGHLVFNNTAAGFEVCFYGTKLEAVMTDAKNAAIVAVLVDGETDPTKINLGLGTDGTLLGDGTRRFTLCEFEEPGIHTVKVQKITEEHLSWASLVSLCVTGALLPIEREYDYVIDVYGDSITAGSCILRADGVPDTSLWPQNGLLTYAYLAAQQLNADVHVFARSGMGLYTNPCNQATNLNGIYQRVSPYSELDWNLAMRDPDAVVINIGTNDLVTTEQNKPAGNIAFDAEVYKQSYVEMVCEMADAYGRDTLFVLCSGLMEDELAPYIEEVVEVLCADGIIAQQLTFDKYYDGHPRVDGHAAAAGKLADTLKTWLDKVYE
ncbi:MAG: hypothetical protein IJC64_04190 [Clostridia bacterium]|nr:hypothetical protein [Clostridia bacterium]